MRPRPGRPVPFEARPARSTGASFRRLGPGGGAVSPAAPSIRFPDEAPARPRARLDPMADLDIHLAAVAAGDEQAFARWLAGAAAPLRDALRAFARQVDVEAVLQEALLRAWQVAPRVAPDGRANALLRFTVRAARNLAVDEARRAGFRAPEGEEELSRLLDGLASAGPPEGPDPLLRRLIAACRDRLAARPRAALDGRLAAGGAEGDAAVAARLGMRVNTSLQNVSRARRALAECLRRAGVPAAEISP